MMRTAFTYDPSHIEHSAPGHPEQKGRLLAVWKALNDQGLAEKLIRLETPLAPLDLIQETHSTRYIEHLHYMVHQGLSYLDADTYCTQHSLEVAQRGLGGLLHLTDAVLRGEVDNGMALPRPPGHHARPHTAMGFCIFANVAIAAKHARKVHGVDRVLILDFDVHHGNGTQEVCYQDPNILFMSLHGAPPFWPALGHISETGEAEGEGYTVNVPLPQGVGDEGYLAAFRQILAPIAARFKPELILVSAGYDAHWRDPIGCMKVSTWGFDQMVLELMSWADQYCSGRLVFALEGGYDEPALAHSVYHTLALLQDPTAKLVDELGKSPEAGLYPQKMIEGIAKFWRV